jgi:hypothetical protein
VLDRLILSAVLGTVGWNGLNPEPPTQPTLKEKAKMKSVSAVCERKGKQSEAVKQLCKRWEVQRNG